VTVATNLQVGMTTGATIHTSGGLQMHVRRRNTQVCATVYQLALGLCISVPSSAAAFTQHVVICSPLSLAVSSQV
jgi:hypothetical protein